MSFLAEIVLRKKRGQTRESIIALFEADLQLEFPETNIAEVVEAAVEPQVVDAHKPRTIPDDEHRCHARTRVDKDHFEDGKLKVMCDDQANLYGGRCKFKKLAEGCFCTIHLETQPLGVWNGPYGGRLLKNVNKLSK
jgi:hypothetical protein